MFLRSQFQTRPESSVKNLKGRSASREKTRCTGGLRREEGKVVTVGKWTRNDGCRSFKDFSKQKTKQVLPKKSLRRFGNGNTSLGSLFSVTEEQWTERHKSPDTHGVVILKLIQEDNEYLYMKVVKLLQVTESSSFSSRERRGQGYHRHVHRGGVVYKPVNWNSLTNRSQWGDTVNEFEETENPEIWSIKREPCWTGKRQKKQSVVLFSTRVPLQKR